MLLTYCNYDDKIQTKKEKVMDKLIDRELYYDKLKGFFNKEVIKIITGIRRCGKSEILKMFKNKALQITDENHIIFINFENSDFDEITTYKGLNTYLKGKMQDESKYYIFLDEIQMVENWEKSVNSLRLKNTDIYITGSNSKLLSGELATLIAGRYIEIKVQTLSFGEFIDFRKQMDFDTESLDKEIMEYIRIGGFPFLSVNSFNEDECRRIIEDINSSSVLKDVINRNKVKNVLLMENLLKFIYDNIGNQFSLRSIVSYLKCLQKGADFETVSNYISYIEGACIIDKVSRYDIKGKRLLESNEKYYLADHSLQYAIRDMRLDKIPGILENIVYQELVRRNYKVYVGKFDTKEIDFVAEKINGTNKVYIQVCYEFSNSEETKKREFDPLLEIKDHYPKYVVTLDKFWRADYDGVRGIHLKDFLLLEKF